ncbi:MAG: hypothetical protein NT093_02370 [Candidatus Moranbacteria bacterium]|nr:hypothetical protein [Candidatus Moranbacteria bacterium]
MIKYGLKIWTSNKHLFREAVFAHQKKLFDFIELYHNANEEVDFDDLQVLKEIPVVVHNTHDSGFHEFKIEKKQLAIWEKTKQLADFFGSPYIIVHSGKFSSFDEFQKNLKKIDDSRILVENMAGLDIHGELTFGYDLLQLEKIKEIKEVCFDLEKAIKSACYQGIDYKKFITDSIKNLKPSYFHISGGDKDTVKDEHKNLWETNFDLRWIKDKLLKTSKDKDNLLVFEVPKNKDDLKNDIENMEYFKKIN